jgi:hypothetical protein
MSNNQETSFAEHVGHFAIVFAIFIAWGWFTDGFKAVLTFIWNIIF